MVVDLLEALEELDRADEEVVEVHRVHALEFAVVELVDVGDGLLEVRADELGVVLRGAQAVLGIGDLGLHRPGREPLGIESQIVKTFLYEAALVGRVVDRELARVAELVGVGAHHPRAGGVEGHDPHRARGAADEQLDALAHLGRRLVGERDREDLARPGLVGPQQVGDPVREDAGLARAGAGQDQQRALAVGDGVALGRIQACEEVVDGGVGGHRIGR